MWQALGIKKIQLQQRPSDADYPPAFNTNCRSTWSAALAEVPNDGPPGDQWTSAIVLFLEKCTERGLHPFSGVQQSRNDQIVMRLRASRSAVIRFLNKAKPFKLMTLRAVRRECILTDRGFILRIVGTVHAKDPTVPKWLLERPWPAFALKSNGVYNKHLDSNTRMVVFNESANMSMRWHLGYEISCNILPSLTNPMPSKAEMEDFILKVLWRRIIADTRQFEYNPKHL